MAHRSILRALACVGAASALLSPTFAQAITTERILSGLSSPLYVTSPVGDARLFIVQQGGLIRIYDGNSVLSPPFLNVDPLTQGGGERGLLGLAFHPDYANNGRFFINYTNNGGDTVVAEYAVSADPNVANPNAVQIILTQNQPFSNHNGGCLQFGPDGFLYIAMGDGGSGNDPGNRAQNLGVNLGKMLRLDIDVPAPFIPASNPFVGNPNANDEIWAYGLRNPWRFSFDGLTGDMWIGDVGQNAREEVDFQPASSTGGENYGWRCMEGFNCTGLSGCTCNAPALTLPIHDYSHAGGNCSITGGYVYRGSAIGGLQGTYFFADFCSNRIWSLRYDGTNVSDFTERTAQLDPPVGNIGSISSFGEDAFGEMYIVDLGGEIYKIIPSCEAQNYCTAAPNSVSSGALIGSNNALSVSANAFVLDVTAGVPNQFGIFFYGAAPANMPFGDGFVCVSQGGSGIFRLNPPQMMNFFGDASRALDFTSPPSPSGAITAGSRWFFQWWYRDPMGPGGSGFNFSNGLDVLFCP